MSNIKLFESKQIRSEWNEEEEQWYFSIIDVIEVLTESPRPRKYWNALKTKIIEEGHTELSQNLGQLKMQSSDGKFYLTDVANTKTLLRIIQSIPSPKAEPFKLWLAQVGSDRLDESTRKYKPYKAYKEELLNVLYSLYGSKTKLCSLQSPAKTMTPHLLHRQLL